MGGSVLGWKDRTVSRTHRPYVPTRLRIHKIEGAVFCAPCVMHAGMHERRPWILLEPCQVVCSCVLLRAMLGVECPSCWLEVQANWLWQMSGSSISMITFSLYMPFRSAVLLYA